MARATGTRAPSRAVAKPSAKAALTRFDASNLPSHLLEKYRKHVSREDAVAEGGAGWPFISTRGGVFTLNDVSEEELEVVILAAMRENTMYEGDYDPDNPQRPVCFAIGEKAEDMAPPADLETRASDDCKSCRNNKFGTSDRGKGKACKNQVRLVVLPADALESAEKISETDGMRLKVPVTSVGNFGSYVKDLRAEYERSVSLVVTRVAIVPDKKTQYKLTFKAVEGIDDPEIMEAIVKKIDVAMTYATQLPQAAGADEDEKKGRDDDRPTKPARRTSRLTRAAAKA